MKREAPTDKRAANASDIVISGDPIGSRILALLLQDSGYRAKYRPVKSLKEPGALEDVQLLLLTPTQALDTEGRKALFALLKEMLREKEVIVMELVSFSGATLEEEDAQELQYYKVLWPCMIDELKQQIEAALLSGAR